MCGQIKFRKGFTLVEILVAITVIAILGGMLLAGLFPALRRAKEAAVQSELKQIELAIENFNTKYGFYPPSFIQFHNLDLNNKTLLMRRFLNRISPNHQESNDRIQAWFLARGNDMNPNLGHDIVFWLSGLFKNKQFPLTGGVVINNATHTANVLPAYSTEAASGDNRELYFSFAANRLNPGSTNPGIAGYSQMDDKFSPLVYIDSASYSIEVTGSPAWNQLNWPDGSRRRNIGYFRRLTGNLLDTSPVTYAEVTSSAVAFENPTTYQLFFSGIDTQCGDNSCVSGFNVRNLPMVDSDNIANFANGRMDSYSNSLTN